MSFKDKMIRESQQELEEGWTLVSRKTKTKKPKTREVKLSNYEVESTGEVDLTQEYLFNNFQTVASVTSVPKGQMFTEDSMKSIIKELAKEFGGNYLELMNQYNDVSNVIRDEQVELDNCYHKQYLHLAKLNGLQPQLEKDLNGLTDMFVMRNYNSKILHKKPEDHPIWHDIRDSISFYIWTGVLPDYNKVYGLFKSGKKLDYDMGSDSSTSPRRKLRKHLIRGLLITTNDPTIKKVLKLGTKVLPVAQSWFNIELPVTLRFCSCSPGEFFNSLKNTISRLYDQVLDQISQICHLEKTTIKLIGKVVLVSMGLVLVYAGLAYVLPTIISFLNNTSPMSEYEEFTGFSVVENSPEEIQEECFIISQAEDSDKKPHEHPYIKRNLTKIAASTLGIESVVENVAKGINLYAGTYNNFERALTSTFNHLTILFSKLYEYATGEPYFDEDILKKEVKDILSELDDINVKSFTMMTKSDAERVVTISDRIERLISGGIGRLKDESLFRTLISKKLLCTSLVDRAKGIIYASQARQQPLCVAFIGKPGIGKTYIKDYLARILSSEIRGKVLAPDDVFSRSIGNEYWEGYNRNWVVNIDDAFASTEASTRGLQADELIKMVNEEAYHLHYAAVTEKTGNYFDSGLVMLTMNYSQTLLPTNMLVVDPIAVYRRMHVKIFLEEKHTYRAESARSSVREDYKYTIIKNDGTKGQSITWDELVTICLEENERLKQNFEKRKRMSDTDVSRAYNKKKLNRQVLNDLRKIDYSNTRNVSTATSTLSTMTTTTTMTTTVKSQPAPKHSRNNDPKLPKPQMDIDLSTVDDDDEVENDEDNKTKNLKSSIYEDDEDEKGFESQDENAEEEQDKDYKMLESLLGFCRVDNADEFLSLMITSSTQDFYELYQWAKSVPGMLELIVTGFLHYVTVDHCPQEPSEFVARAPRHTHQQYYYYAQRRYEWSVEWNGNYGESLDDLTKKMAMFTTIVRQDVLHPYSLKCFKTQPDDIVKFDLIRCFIDRVKDKDMTLPTIYSKLVTGNDDFGMKNDDILTLCNYPYKAFETMAVEMGMVEQPTIKSNKTWISKMFSYLPTRLKKATKNFYHANSKCVNVFMDGKDTTINYLKLTITVHGSTTRDVGAEDVVAKLIDIGEGYYPMDEASHHWFMTAVRMYGIYKFSPSLYVTKEVIWGFDRSSCADCSNANLATFSEFVTRSNPAFVQRATVSGVPFPATRNRVALTAKYSLLAKALLIVPAVAMLGSVVYALFKKAIPTVPAQSSAGPKDEKRQKPQKRRPPPKALAQIHKEIPSAQSGFDSLVVKYIHNLEYISIYYEEGHVSHNFMFFMNSEIAVFPTHSLKHGTITKMVWHWTMTPGNSDITVRPSQYTVSEIPGKDLSLVKFNFTTAHKKSAEKHLFAEKDLPSNFSSDLWRMDVSTTGVTVLKQAQSAQRDSIKSQMLKTGKLHVVNDCYKVYGIKGEGGDCVLPYVTENTPGGLIVGFHVAGIHDVSYASTLTKEDYKQALSKFDAPESQSLLDFSLCFPENRKIFVKYDGEATENKIPGARHVGDIYELKPSGLKEKVSYMPAKTKIRKNRLYDEDLGEQAGISHDKIPAVLGAYRDEKGEIKTALSNALTRWHGRNKSVTDGIFDTPEVWNGVFHPNFDAKKVRIATLDEAINGVEGAKFFKSLDFSKSASLGFSEYGMSMDELFPRIEPDNPNNHRRKAIPSLEKLLNERWALIEQGLFCPYMCVATLKDELKLRGKHLKPRLFANGSKLNLIEARRIFGLFFEQVVSHGGDGDVYVGINPHSFQWDALFAKLAKMSIEKLIASDIEAWDFNLFIARFGQSFEKECLRRGIPKFVVNMMMGVLRTTMFPNFIIGSAIFQIFGMPSGSFITAIMNSIFNSWSNRCCWVNYREEIMYKYLDKCVEDFAFDNVMAQGTFGDDLISSVCEWLRTEDWNGRILADVREKLFQLKTTSLKKDGSEVEEFVKLTVDTWDPLAAQFLQRQFRVEDGRVYPILNLTSIEAMVQYVVPNDEIPLQRMEEMRFESAIEELAYYPKEIYDKYHALFLTMIRRKKPGYRFPVTREQVLHRFFNS